MSLHKSVRLHDAQKKQKKKNTAVLSRSTAVLFCRKDWLWKMTAEAMSEIQRQLRTSVCLLQCGMRACRRTMHA